MKRLKIKILSWLLHHANREYRNEHFYKIKNEILKKYGNIVGYDTQHIEGKKCNSCHGSGQHHSYYHNQWHVEACYHCYGGWYKRPQWNYLQRVQLGRHIFHQPWKRAYEKPESTPGLISGYIEHQRSKHGQFARAVLFLIYEKGYLQRWWKDAGMGWRMQWWRPSSWPNNFAHIIKQGWYSIPGSNLIKMLTWLWDIRPIGMIQFQTKVRVERLRYHNHIDNDLPF